MRHVRKAHAAVAGIREVRFSVDQEPRQADRMKWGDDVVRVERPAWRASTGVSGYRKTYRLRPGEHWADAPVTDGQYEHLVETDDGAIPVGLKIAQELVGGGAEWAVMVELWGRAVLVDHRGVCVSVDGPIGELVSLMIQANGKRWGGFPDVVGALGDKILLREAKVGGKRDRLRPNQHDFLRAMRRGFGDRVDAAVVEWDLDG